MTRYFLGVPGNEVVNQTNWIFPFISPTQWDEVNDLWFAWGEDGLFSMLRKSESIVVIVSLFGVLMNVLCILTFLSKRSKLRGSTRWFFVCMHTSDSVFLLAFFAEEGIGNFLTGNPKNELVAEYLTRFGHDIGYFARAFSNFMVAAIYLDRAICVSKPVAFKVLTKSLRYKAIVLTVSAVLSFVTRTVLFADTESSLYPFLVYAPTVTDACLCVVIVVNSGIVIRGVFRKSDNNTKAARNNRSIASLLICICTSFTIEQICNSIDYFQVFLYTHFNACSTANDVMASFGKFKYVIYCIIAKDWATFWSHGANFLSYCMFNRDVFKCLLSVFSSKYATTTVAPSSHQPETAF